MKKGVYTFKGGTDYIIKMMQDELLKNEVDIKKHAKVEKILIKDGVTKGVVVAGQEIKSKAVVSNGNLQTTVLNMIDPEILPTEFISRTKEVRLNSSSCQVYIGIKPECKIDHIGDLIFTSTYPTFDTDALMDFRITSRTFSIYYPEGRPFDENQKYAIVSSTNCHYDDWKKLDEYQYKEEKQKMIDETIECLEKFIPDIRDKIDYIDAATPLTVERYTHHKKGASFGTKFEGLDISMNLHKYVPGLFHAGSVGIIMSGWLGAANYGVIQANEVSSYLFTQKEN